MGRIRLKRPSIPFPWFPVSASRIVVGEEPYPESKESVLPKALWSTGLSKQAIDEQICRSVMVVLPG